MWRVCVRVQNLQQPCTTHGQAPRATDTANNNPYTPHVNNNNNYYYKSGAKIKVTKARVQGGAVARAIHTRARRRRLRSAIDGRESRSHMSDTWSSSARRKGQKYYLMTGNRDV